MAGNRILCQQIQGCVRVVSDREWKVLGELGKRFCKKALEEVASLVKPDTMRAWHRALMAGSPSS